MLVDIHVTIISQNNFRRPLSCYFTPFTLYLSSAIVKSIIKLFIKGSPTRKKDIEEKIQKPYCLHPSFEKHFPLYPTILFIISSSLVSLVANTLQHSFSFKYVWFNDKFIINMLSYLLCTSRFCHCLSLYLYIN